jgi:hypothetical protein
MKFCLEFHDHFREERRGIMRNIILLFSGVALLVLITGCAQTKLYDYKPASADEKNVYDFFVECDKAVGEKKLEKYLACY